jgi:hypothetical protein
MVGPLRPHFVLFGSSIVQQSFSNEGWGAILADLYARKVISSSFSLLFFWFKILCVCCNGFLMPLLFRLYVIVKVGILLTMFVVDVKDIS